ncbi:uncharacterized protein PHALS_13467 [Plasmopara halstedii]|uniref:Uncharacterized protein n=1 Tax=Plasmopara halstedii TaxID=4781 RepID=A0A0P1AP02_PLAHL|nr:uncharacterized protein PHALS_13467 [Plasmopara halstedii]CEG43258.1 hypothetical protein PHALS_13467 [Plasmopara halstedii]|eukprot:XP_024579627.1 hypothetical protein PHALS_13467 [Plasmopara halstedii]
MKLWRSSAHQILISTNCTMTSYRTFCRSIYVTCQINTTIAMYQHQNTPIMAQPKNSMIVFPAVLASQTLHAMLCSNCLVDMTHFQLLIVWNVQLTFADEALDLRRGLAVDRAT